MTSVFDFDDALNLAYEAKTAGKNLVTAKHEVLTKTGDFLFLAHSDKEFALRCQMAEADIESAAHRKMATVSDSKFKLVRALHEEWKIRHAHCGTCPESMKEKEEENRKASKGDQKNCAECGKPATEHDVRGYLELCANCAGKRTAGTDTLKEDTTNPSSKAEQKLAKLQERLAMGYETKTVGNRNHSITDQGMISSLMKSPGVRLLDQPGDEQNLREGQFVGLQHILPGDNKGYVTLGRTLGAVRGGLADVGDRMCTGNGFEGHPCGHTPKNPGLHAGVTEMSTRMLKGPNGLWLSPGLEHTDEKTGERSLERAQGRETVLHHPVSRIFTLPEGNSDTLNKYINLLAQRHGFAVQHPETGEMVHPVNAPHEDLGKFVEQLGAAKGNLSGPRQGFAQIVGHSLLRDTQQMGHTDNEPPANKWLSGIAGDKKPAVDEGGPYVLNGGPRDHSKEGGGKLIPGQEGKRGSGQLAPIIHLEPRVSGKGVTGTEGIHPDGTPIADATREQLRYSTRGTEHYPSRLRDVSDRGDVEPQDRLARHNRFKEIRSISDPSESASKTNPGSAKIEDYTDLLDF